MKAFFRSITLGDAFLVAGFFSLIRGVAMVNAAAAWIVAGVLLLYASFSTTRTAQVPISTPTQKTRPSAS